MTALPLLAGWEQRGPDPRYVVAVHRKVMPSDTHRNAWYEVAYVAVVLALATGVLLTAGVVAALGFLFLGALRGAFVAIEFRRANTRLQLDPTGVVLVNTFGTRRYRWAELEGVTVVPGIGVALAASGDTVVCDALRMRWFRWQRPPSREAECVLAANNAAAWLETVRIGYRVAAAGSES